MINTEPELGIMVHIYNPSTWKRQENLEFKSSVATRKFQVRLGYNTLSQPLPQIR